MIFDPQGIIKKIQANISCPVCQRHFKSEEIRLRQIIENTIIFHAHCSKNHPPVQIINIAIIYNKTKIPKSNPVDKEYIKLVNKQIDEFNGDFISLWKK